MSGGYRDFQAGSLRRHSNIAGHHMNSGQDPSYPQQPTTPSPIVTAFFTLLLSKKFLTSTDRVVHQVGYQYFYYVVSTFGPEYDVTP